MLGVPKTKKDQESRETSHTGEHQGLSPKIISNLAKSGAALQSPLSLIKTVSDPM